jgi:hypothetical protein
VDNGAAPGAPGEAAAGEVADREGEGAAIVQATEARRSPKPENWGTMSKAQRESWKKHDKREVKRKAAEAAAETTMRQGASRPRG